MRASLIPRCVAEASLGQLEAVQSRLAQNERDLQLEIDSLQDELGTEQDPNRMHLIQEMISVRPHTMHGGYLPCLNYPFNYLGFTGADVSYTGESDRIRSSGQKYNQGNPSVRLGEKKSYIEYDYIEEAADAWCVVAVLCMFPQTHCNRLLHTR